VVCARAKGQVQAEGKEASMAGLSGFTHRADHTWRTRGVCERCAACSSLRAASMWRSHLLMPSVTPPIDHAQW